MGEGRWGMAPDFLEVLGMSPYLPMEWVITYQPAFLYKSSYELNQLATDTCLDFGFESVILGIYLELLEVDA